LIQSGSSTVVLTDTWWTTPRLSTSSRPSELTVVFADVFTVGGSTEVARNATSVRPSRSRVRTGSHSAAWTADPMRLSAPNRDSCGIADNRSVDP
jgi:hypothetical protein